jgi:hypothetical protein
MTEQRVRRGASRAPLAARGPLGGRARTWISAALASGACVVLLAGPASAREGVTAGAAKHAFLNKLTPPPTPAMIPLGSDLLGSPAALLGNTAGDTESWNVSLAWNAYAARAAVLAKQTTVPVEGWLVGVTLKGYAVSGDMPGPGGSEPFRVGVEQVLPSGQLEVLSTSNPPFQLPGTSGTYSFAVGPPATGFAMRLRKGNVVSFDNRGGTWAVYASVPGSSTDYALSMGGLEQNAGVKWTGTPRANTELLLQVTEQPKVPSADLEKAAALTGEAQALERLAASAAPAKARRNLKQAGERLQAALKVLEAAAVGSIEGEAGPALAELSPETAASIKHYLALALAEARLAGGKRLTHKQRADHLKAVGEALRTAQSDIRKATQLAKQAP